MTNLAIRVNCLSKCFRIGTKEEMHDTFVAAFTSWLRSPVRNFRRLRSLTNFTDSSADIIWALKDIDFEVEQGEVLGVIGRNGAGKTTLLKLLSRITPPTTGRIELKGRVASLLEVGTGFHPELTGRENVYLNGTILGMKKTEIDEKLDAIVSFAGISSFLDTPVKRYSSGMHVRLAFSVAAHLEPDILLIDEVLAVGDSQFREKCMGKMKDVAKAGRTILFVSHNLQSISTLTRRALLLEGGRLQFQGETSEALRRYRALWSTPKNTDLFTDTDKSEGVVSARVVTSEPNQYHKFGKPLEFEFTVIFRQPPKSAAFSFQIVDDQMRPIVHLWIYDSEKKWSRTGLVTLRCLLTKPRLFMGSYTITTHLAERTGNEKLERLESICPFTVVMDDIANEYNWTPGACTYLEDAEWSTTSI